MANDDKQAIMDQVIAVFGSGAGAARIERKALAALREHYEPLINKNVIEQWEKEAVQALERIRVLGRQAAQHMVNDGRSSISRNDVNTSIESVESSSATGFCQPGTGGG